MRWSVLIFIIGFVVLLVAFRSSTVIAVFGFLVMLFAALMFERSARRPAVAETPPVVPVRQPDSARSSH